MSVFQAGQHVTQYQYDDDGRRTATIYNDQTQDQVGYDQLGRQTSKTDQAGKVTQFGYDALGRLTSVTQSPDGGVTQLVTTYGYDELGNRISQTDANGHTTTYAYDQMGRRISRTLPLSNAINESYGYDANGNLMSKTDFNGHTTAYTYDTMNRLLSKTADQFFSTGACAGGACGATQISFTYTATGKRLTMTDASGTTTYGYDGGDRLTAKRTPFDNVGLGYDLNGNLTSLTGGLFTTYTYDTLNRLATASTSFAPTVTYGYDLVGNLQSQKADSISTTSYTYDTLNRLTKMQGVCGSSAGKACGGSGATSSSYAYTLGAAGNRLSVAELSGRTVNYGYDDLYRLTSETVAGDPRGNNGAVNYSYDNVGNRVQRTSTLAAVPATGLLNYDANDRTSTDSYDPNGNLLASGAGTNVYDFENRLVQAGGVRIVYDGDGNRVQETVAGVVTRYVVSEVNPTGYAQVLEERNAQGGLIRGYEWGLQLIGQRDFSIGDVIHLYGMDGHGSVRYLTDTTGVITDTYDYDAFGNLISRTGTTFNNYLFAGEQFDPALGVYYNRARYYDQRMGRFWTMDTWEGKDAEPLSLHKYLYAQGDPVDNPDPSGNQIDELAAANSIATSLNGVDTLQGQGIIDQVKYGGNAGLKSLVIGAAVTILTPVAIAAIGGLLRAIPFQKLALPVGAVSQVIKNALSNEEAAFAEEVVSFRWGQFVGPPTGNFPGIDGWIDGIPASLKVLSTSNLQGVVDQVERGTQQALSAGYTSGELFVKAPNFSSADFFSANGGSYFQDVNVQVNKGAFNAVNIQFSNGWVRIVSGTALAVSSQ